jgi:uncharacterized protein YidB (DUF937 family)
MSLLNSVLGAVTGNHNAAAAGGGLGGLIGTLAQNPKILQAVTDMLGNNSAQGGLGGLMERFQQAGLGDVMNSWVGTGANQPISGDQLGRALGQDTLTDLAAKIGMDRDAAAGQLSTILPGIIDRLTPQGQAPQGGLGNAGDLMRMLGGMLGKP